MNHDRIEDRRESTDGLAYEAHHSRLSGLCPRCHDNAALPGYDTCADCEGDVQNELDRRDPKRASHHGVHSDAWDNRDKSGGH